MRVCQSRRGAGAFGQPFASPEYIHFGINWVAQVDAEADTGGDKFKMVDVSVLSRILVLTWRRRRRSDGRTPPCYRTGLGDW